MSAPQRPPEQRSGAGTWLMLLVVLALIGAVGYFGFYKTGRETDKGRAPEVVPLTPPSTVPQATPTPSGSPTPFAATPAPED